MGSIAQTSIQRHKKMPLGLKIMIAIFFLAIGMVATVIVIGVNQAEKEKKMMAVEEPAEVSEADVMRMMRE